MKSTRIWKREGIFLKKVLLVYGVSTFFPFVSALAASADITETELGGVQNYSEFISAAWKWGSGVVFAVAIIAIIMGGIILTSSGGNEDRADMGRQTVRGGVIAIFITLFSAVFNTFIKSPVEETGTKNLGDLSGDLETAATALTSVIGAVAALGIVYAGIKYMTAGGDEEKIDSAKKALRMSIYGAVIALSAWVISAFLLQST